MSIHNMFWGKAEDFLIWNPLLYSDLDKYIWISDSYEEHRNAQRLFDLLLKRNIYIKGFATDAPSMVHLRMYNKEIFNVATLDCKRSAVFLDRCYGDTNIRSKYQMEWDRIINPNIIKKRIVIWGAGKTGEYACKILLQDGIKAEYFVDSNEEAEGTVKHGLQVYKINRLNECGSDIAIIEALEKWELLDERIRDKYTSRFHFDLKNHIRESITCNVDGVEKKIFCLTDFWMSDRLVGKRVYVYGNGIVEKEFAKYLKLMDFDFCGFLIDEVERANVENESPIQYVEEILYEKKYYIWVCDRKRVQKLNELGLQYFAEYECSGCIRDITIQRENQLDVNLGYTYATNNKYPGIIVHGGERVSDYKIVILGGSTTDGKLYPFKSWPQLLYEALEEKMDLTVYNSGLCGYTSCQELLKMLRDMILLKPDMIIVYDGFNDFYFTDASFPFAINYSRQVFEFAKGHVDDVLVEKNEQHVCLGIESKGDSYTNWLSNIRSMYAVASERNISFYSFCQPWLISKGRKTEEEKNMILSIESSILNKSLKASFRKHIGEMTDLPEYIYDLSHIFDKEEDIYMDMCHVWEKGNRIIAEEIKKVILPELQLH